MQTPALKFLKKSVICLKPEKIHVNFPEGPEDQFEACLEFFLMSQDKLPDLTSCSWPFLMQIVQVMRSTN